MEDKNVLVTVDMVKMSSYGQLEDKNVLVTVDMVKMSSYGQLEDKNVLIMAERLIKNLTMWYKLQKIC